MVVKKTGSEEKLQKQQQRAVREEHNTVKQRTGRLCFTVPQHCSPGERGKTRAAYQGELLNHTGEKHTKAGSEGWKTRQDKLWHQTWFSSLLQHLLLIFFFFKSISWTRNLWPKGCNRQSNIQHSACVQQVSVFDVFCESGFDTPNQCSYFVQQRYDVKRHETKDFYCPAWCNVSPFPASAAESARVNAQSQSHKIEEVSLRMHHNAH